MAAAMPPVDASTEAKTLIATVNRTAPISPEQGTVWKASANSVATGVRMNENHLLSLLLATWAVAVLVLSSLSASGRIKTVTINGMRRRRPGETADAWQAGLRAYFPWAVATACSLLLFAGLVLLAPPEFLYPLVGGAFVLVIIQGWPLGIWALNLAIVDFRAAQKQ